MSSCLLSIDGGPRVEDVLVFVDVVIHRFSEKFFIPVPFQVTVISWQRWEISLISFSILEGRLPHLGHSLLVEIDESVTPLLLDLVNYRWLDIRRVW